MSQKWWLFQKCISGFKCAVILGYQFLKFHGGICFSISLFSSQSPMWADWTIYLEENASNRSDQQTPLKVPMMVSKHLDTPNLREDLWLRCVLQCHRELYVTILGRPNEASKCYGAKWSATLSACRMWFPVFFFTRTATQKTWKILVWKENGVSCLW